jgi:hypothetical protein
LEKGVKSILKFANHWFSEISNPVVRLLYSRLYNPILFKEVTLFVDSKHYLVKLIENKNEKLKRSTGKSNITSYKYNFKNGLVLQQAIDSRKMTNFFGLLSLGANESNDRIGLKLDLFSKELEDINHIIDPKSDCIIADNHYSTILKNEFEKLENYSEKNLCSPMFKEKNKS